jgi:tetratricopeptide (TPR) repeat protein
MTDRDFASTSGGGERFMQFIEKELIPHVDAKYPTAPYRLISGHSLGGLTVVNAFAYHNNLFNAYIAIDPSLWWDQQKFLKRVESDFAAKKLNQKALFVAIATPLLPPGLDTLTALKDSSNYTALFRSVTHFVQTLKQNPANGLRWKSKFYPEERHGTVQLNAQYDALKFLFNYYQFRTSQFEFHPELDMDSVVVVHFKNVSNNLGYTVLPSEQLVNNLGYTCMGLQQPKKAYAFFKRNTDNYPQSSNAFDSLGDYYVWQNERTKAIAAFTESLRLHETADTRSKLENLKKKK